MFKLLRLFSPPDDYSYVVRSLEKFINQTGKVWDWDDFTTSSFKQPELEEIRRQAQEIDLPVTVEGSEKLRSLLMRAKTLQAHQAAHHSK